MIEGKTEIRLIKQDRSIIEGLEAVIGGLPVASVCSHRQLFDSAKQRRGRN